MVIGEVQSHGLREVDSVDSNLYEDIKGFDVRLVHRNWGKINGALGTGSREPADQGNYVRSAPACRTLAPTRYSHRRSMRRM